MPIDLGLFRVKTLLSQLGNPHVKSFKSIHVAGTNGKGSTVAYLSSIFTQANIRNGRFTSPHLITYNDCIAINNQIYPRNNFETVKDLVSQQNILLNLGCTEFEILTATAFKIFELEKVELAIIEVGLGGRLDATNVLLPHIKSERSGGVIMTAITKVGFDHEGLLGTSITSIAKEKAGIIKDNIPVVVDNTNTIEVIDVVKSEAAARGATLFKADTDLVPCAKELVKESPLHGDYQISNLSVALKVTELVKEIMNWDLKKEVIISGIRNTHWPGRLQKLTDSRTGVEVLIDGAHNESAASELKKFLEKSELTPAIFVVAMTEGKNIDKLLKYILSYEGSALIPFTFTQPDAMPWVRCYKASEIQKVARKYTKSIIQVQPGNVKNLFNVLAKMKKSGDERAVVICGSLYLCSDILRQLHAHSADNSKIK